MKEIEVPGTWFFSGMTVSAIGIVSIQVVSFSSTGDGDFLGLDDLFPGLVACRATGRRTLRLLEPWADHAALLRRNCPCHIVTNLMTACVTAGAAASRRPLDGPKIRLPPGGQSVQAVYRPVSRDLRRRLVIVPASNLIVPTPDVLVVTVPCSGGTGVERVAELLATDYPASISPSDGAGCRWPGGYPHSLLERLLPARVRPFIHLRWGWPGLCYSLLEHLIHLHEAFIAWILSKKAKDLASQYTIPVASGMIAGESLMGVMVALFGMLGIMG